MKKNVLTIICCLFVSLVVASAYLYAATGVGTILKVRKDVYRIRNSDRSPAKPQMPLFMNDSVETGKQARTKMSFTDNSIIHLGELSRMEVQEYIYSKLKKKSKSIYRLVDGSLRVVVGRSDLKIHTRSAVVAARGTEFVLWIGAERGKMFTGVIMIEGETTAESIVDGVKGKETIRKGQMCRIFLNEPPEKPRPTDTRTMDRFSGEFDAIQSSSHSLKKSEVTGKILNKSEVKDSSNIAVGEGSQANTGSVVME